MKKYKIAALMLALTLIFAGCTTGKEMSNQDNLPDGAVAIDLSDDQIKVDGKKATTDTDSQVYIANDIVYYEKGKFLLVKDGGDGWPKSWKVIKIA